MSHCCEMMRSNVENSCALHPDRFDCPDCLIDYAPADQSYGIIVHDGGHSSISIQNCPWCGARLPQRSEHGVPRLP